MAWAGTLDDVPLGASESLTRTITAADIDNFAQTIGSQHPIHMDDEWARTHTKFPGRLAHGVMMAALLSRPLASLVERLRLNTALLSTSAKFVAPVLVGDTITVEVKVAEKIPERKRLKFAVEARNQRGEVVMVGEAQEQLL